MDGCHNGNNIAMPPLGLDRRDGPKEIKLIPASSDFVHNSFYGIWNRATGGFARGISLDTEIGAHNREMETGNSITDSNAVCGFP